MTTKTAASEGQVGRIHKLATDIYEMKLTAILKEMQDNPEDAQYIGDIKTIQAADKWAQYNEIKSTLPQDDAKSPLRQELDNIKKFKMKVDPTIAKEA